MVGRHVPAVCSECAQVRGAGFGKAAGFLQSPPLEEVTFLKVGGLSKVRVSEGEHVIQPTLCEVGVKGAELVPEHPPGQFQKPSLVKGSGGFRGATKRG